MLDKLQAFLRKTRLHLFLNRETLRYALGGVATTLLNIGTYRILLLLGVPFKPANLIAIILAKIAAFFVNKHFVFRAESQTVKALLLEIFRYIYTRGFTMLIDYFGLILLVDVMGGNEKYMKYITTVVVVIINYLFGKFLVFNTKSNTEHREENA